MTALAWFLWHVGVATRLVVSDAGVEVVNVFRHHKIAWSDIVDLSSDGNVIFHLKNGRRVVVMTSGDSLISAFQGNRRQRGLRRQISEARIAALAKGSQRGFTSRSWWKAHPIPFLGIAVFFCSGSRSCSQPTATAAGVSIVYVRDAADRLVARAVSGSSNPDDNGTTYYAYSGDGDSADLIPDAAGALAQRELSLPGGVLLTRPRRKQEV
jgi:Protein of unknown function (DUF2581).